MQVRNAAAVIMMIAYGYKVSSLDDEFIAAAEETSRITGLAMAPGRWLVDSFPLREHYVLINICLPSIS